MDQIFAIKMMVEEYLGKGEKFYAAFIDLETTKSIEKLSELSENL